MDHVIGRIGPPEDHDECDREIERLRAALELSQGNYATLRSSQLVQQQEYEEQEREITRLRAAARKVLVAYDREYELVETLDELAEALGSQKVTKPEISLPSGMIDWTDEREALRAEVGRLRAELADYRKALEWVAEKSSSVISKIYAQNVLDRHKAD